MAHEGEGKMEYRELEYLRKHTFINPIKKLKVLALRDEAEAYQAMMEEFENCHLGIDYSEADELEYKYRLQSWTRSILYLWIEYGGTQELDEFAMDMLHAAMEGKKLLR